MGNDVSSQSDQGLLLNKSDKLIIQKWWFWIALAVIIVAGAIYIFKFGVADSVSTSPKGTLISSTNTKEYKVGEVIATKGSLNVVVHGFREYSQGASSKPSDGNIFYYIDVEIQNTDTMSVQINSTLNFDLRNTDGQKYTISKTAALEGSGLPDGTILPGKKLRGELAYELPENITGLELFIKPDIFTGTFVVNLEK